MTRSNKYLTKASTFGKIRRFGLSLLVSLAPFLFSGCGIYSFTGTSLSPDIKTFTVLNFNMGTAGGPANLPLTFTEKLKEYFQRNTNLTQVPNGGDLLLEGTITGYDVVPMAPTANDQAGLNRLNVTVQTRFTNNKDETKNFDQSFTFYADFPQGQTLNQNEARLLPGILDQLVQDIFNKSAADW
ncbi:hypothetical protein GCM10027275_11690 [Rhabdobacter roseus]|uniref:Lipopolysaccharide-assembly n=1 Tax=Rhabdobacter roseus TaxID=1655419 RepID=A0A840TID3_9BACT|nr:LptE family protein [Rhabdobacter roseus]MBB5283081.1 hypothetical protein [Rhabdobacter roseus]